LATATLLRAGDVIGGFRIDDVIGIGGMAIVYRAEQVSLGRPVALKVLSNKLTRDEVFRERFRREGTHAAALEHPNIVPVYDSGEQDGLLYLAMRLVEGTNLAELIQTRGLTADQTIEILRPIASALDTAHAAGLIHRDVKPQNILITAQNHPYLADFGVAKGSNTDGLTATGGFVGSVNYASPEQIKGLTLTPASDVYALTAVLYQCLTGHVPYPRETDAGIMHAHLTEPPPTLPSLTGADSDFHTVFARGMAKDPGARYGHAGDLVNAAGLSVSRMPSNSRKAVPAFPVGAASDSVSVDTSSADLGADNGAASPADVSSFTVADQRRAPAPEPEDQTARSRPRWPLVAGLAGLVAVVIAAVLVLSGSGRPHTATISRGFIKLGYAKPWRAVAAKSDAYGLHFENPIGLSNSTASLTAGTLANGAPIPGAPPPGLHTGSRTSPQKTGVRLATAMALRYDFHRGITDMSLIVIPTTRVDLAVLCSSTSQTGLTSCVKVAQTAQIIGLQAVPAGADPALAQGLSMSLAASLAARTKTAGLSSSHLPMRAEAARGIAAAYTQTVHSLDELSPESRDRQGVAALASALGREASALGSLAVAVVNRDHHGYEAAVAAIGQSHRRLGLALSKLREMGFVHLRPVPALNIASFPTTPSHPSVPTHHTGRTASTAAVVPVASQGSAAPEVPASSVPEASALAPSKASPSHQHNNSPQVVVSAPK
jgi:serine/threonine protein kinase